MADLIKNIYQKGTTGSTAIGANGENVSLNTGNSSVNAPEILTAVTNTTNAIYYNNVQAQMYRKGFQIKNLNTNLASTASALSTSISSLNSNISNYVHKTDDVTGGSVSTNNKVLTQASTISDGKVKLSDTNAALINRNTVSTNQSNVDILQEAIPYLLLADPTNTNATVSTLLGWSLSTASTESLINGGDGLYKIAQKYNSLFYKIASGEESDDALIDKYYTQGQSYIVPKSTILGYYGRPILKNNQLTQGGFQRYTPYIGTVTQTPTTKAAPWNSTVPSTYQGPVLSYQPNQPYQLYDQVNKKLPTAPSGYRWKCVFVRGTSSHIQNEGRTDEYTKYSIWEMLDGYHTFGGYTSSNFVSLDINIPNMYKGTYFDNLGAIVKNGSVAITRYATQGLDQWNSCTLTPPSSDYVYSSYTPNSCVSLLNNSDIPYKFLIIPPNSTSEKSRYQSKRILGRRKHNAGNISTVDIEAFQRCGNKYNQEDKIRFEASCGGSSAQSYFTSSEGLGKSLSRAPIGASLKNFVVELYFKNPFMYAEYTLVKTSENPLTNSEVLYWWDKKIENNGSGEDDAPDA